MNKIPKMRRFLGTACAAALLLAACAFDSVPAQDTGAVFGGTNRVFDSLAPGLYAEGGSVPLTGSPDAEGAGFLAAAFEYLAHNAQSGGAYRIVLGRDEAQRQKLIYPGIFGGAENVSLSLTGSKAERVIALEDTGNLYAVREGAKLILGAGITLRGTNGNTQPLVLVTTGGALRMEEGSLVTGNHNSRYEGGGGVRVNEHGVFTMAGGEVSGHYGGGVFIEGGRFVMEGGSVIRNTASGSYFAGGVVLYSISDYSYISGYSNCRPGAFLMQGGLICGNTNSFGYAGGVYVRTNWDGSVNEFKKTGGVITGYVSDQIRGNKVLSYGGLDRGNGHAIWCRGISLSKTISASHNLDSSKLGYEGGWYNE